MSRSAVFAGALLFVAAAAAHASAATRVADAAGARAFVRSDAGARLSGIGLVLGAGLDRQPAGRNGLSALVAETILHTPVAGAGRAPLPLVDAVAAAGGSITATVTPRYVRFYLEAQPEDLGRVAALAARALSTPSFDDATVAAARAVLTTRIDDAARNPVLAGLDAVRNAYYVDAGALPALGSAASLAQLGAADARAFFLASYLRGDAFVTEAGRTGEAADAAAAALVTALRAGSAGVAPPLRARALGKEPRRIVLRRDVFAPYAVLGFAAPALGDPDFAAALVVRALVADVLNGESATSLPALGRAVGAVYAYDVAPAQLALWINGAVLDPSTGIAGVTAVLASTGKKTLAPAVLTRYKDIARGTWQLESVSLDERSWAQANAVAQGLAPDAGDAVPSAIDRVTAQDVVRAAKTWFARYDVALIVPRGGGG